MIRFLWIRNLFKPASVKWWIVAWTLLLIAAAVALPLGIWRSIITDRQADATQRQSELAHQNMLNERFHKGAEMLGHPDIRSVRLGGIHALGRLAAEHPETFHLPVMQLFAAFVVDQTATSEAPEQSDDSVDLGPGGNDNSGEPRSVNSEEECGDIAETLKQYSPIEFYLAIKETIPLPPRLAKDVEEVMRLIAERTESQVALEKECNFRLNLADVSLGELTLPNANFSNINFTKANLRRIKIWGVQFSNVVMPGADLSAADLTGADLRDTDMRRVNLTAVNLMGADLRNADLGLVDLAGHNLWAGRLVPSKLVGAMMQGADLRGVNLARADLREASLGGAKLDGANLSGADLSSADLRAASLHKTDLRRANLKSVSLGGAGANLRDVNLTSSDLTGANLGSAKLTDADLSDANISGADFSHDHMSGHESPASGMTQQQLDKAKADPNHPPVLVGVWDSVTDKPLAWNGRST